MSEGKNLTKQVEEINAELRAFGRAAVQEIKIMKDGKVIGCFKNRFYNNIQERSYTWMPCSQRNLKLKMHCGFKKLFPKK